MVLLLQILATFGLGAVNIALAIPAGVVAGLPYPLAILCAMMGTAVAVLLVVYAGGWLRVRLLAVSRGRRAERMMRWVDRATEKYGALGFGVLAPLLLGIPVAAALAATAGMSRRLILVMMGAWAAAWSAVFGIAFAFDLAGLYRFLTGF